MKKIILSLLIVTLSWQTAFCAPQNISQQDIELQQWMTYYYFHKDNTKINSFFSWLQDSQLLEKNEGAYKPIVAFLSVLFEENKAQVKAWLEEKKFNEKTKKAMQEALWLSANKDLALIIFKEAPQYYQSPTISLLSMPLKHGSDLDMMWGAFMASGDKQYVKKIIDTLDETTHLSGHKLFDQTIRASAVWSLGSNMIQHDLVERIVRSELSTRTDNVKEKLELIIQKNKKQMQLKQFPHRHGDFSAAMVVTDEKQLSEYGKTPEKTLNFTEISKIKPGHELAIKIVFSGMELTEEQMSDVTFNLKILGPDGQILNGADYKNLEALKIKTPTRFGIFNNKSFIKISFEPQDKLGKYKFLATITDNVGKKSVPLQKEIELVQ